MKMWPEEAGVTGLFKTMVYVKTIIRVIRVMPGILA
jgi:hypothetical protein